MLKLKKPLNISQISSVRESPKFYMFYLRKNKQTINIAYSTQVEEQDTNEEVNCFFPASWEEH